MAAASRAGFHNLSAASTSRLRRNCSRRQRGVDRKAAAGFDRHTPFVQLGYLALSGEEDRARPTFRRCAPWRAGSQVPQSAPQRRRRRCRRAPATMRPIRQPRRRRRRRGPARARRVRVCGSRYATRRGRRQAAAIEQRAGIGRERQSGLAHLRVDEAFAAALVIRVARQRRGVFGALDQRAQRRVARQIAGLDNHAALRATNCEQRLDRRRDVAAAGLDPDGAPTAEQRNGLRLFDQPQRLGRKVVAFEPRQRERIVDIVDRGPDQRIGTLADQAGVRPEYQHDRFRRVGPGYESVNVRGFDGNHGSVRFLTSPPR